MYYSEWQMCKRIIEGAVLVYVQPMAPGLLRPATVPREGPWRAAGWPISKRGPCGARLLG
jgi:hypothetical protein